MARYYLVHDNYEDCFYLATLSLLLAQLLYHYNLCPLYHDESSFMIKIINEDYFYLATFSLLLAQFLYDYILFHL